MKHPPSEILGARAGVARELASGVGFTEGPVWAEGRVVVASISRGLLYEVPLAGGSAAVLGEPGGGPNGLAYDPGGGTLWVAQNGGVHLRANPDKVPARAGLQRVLADRRVEDVRNDGCNAPNDLVVGPDGRLWFTDPCGDPHEGDPETGHVYAYDVAHDELELITSTDGYPNGLAFGPGGRDLYLAETRWRRVVRLRRGSSGWEREQTLDLVRGAPDGIAVTEEGHLLVAATDSGTVEVFAPDGRPLEPIDCGPRSFPTNVCFAGDDACTIVVTLPRGGRVVAFESGVPGLPLANKLAGVPLSQSE